MIDFMQDVRVAFNEPGLPFILAGPGMKGFKNQWGGKDAICEAQKKATERPEFNESTAYVESRHFAPKSVQHNKCASCWPCISCSCPTYYLIHYLNQVRVPRCGVLLGG